ncbi:MAG: hypothetical protein ACRETZ_13790, partial [Steroidobacteraceae bacterium]
MPIGQPELTDPLILAIGRSGGHASKKQTLIAMAGMIEDKLDDDDWQIVGDPRKSEASWENKAAWERNRLVDEGLLLNIQRDDWRLSD